MLGASWDLMGASTANRRLSTRRVAVSTYRVWYRPSRILCLSAIAAELNNHPPAICRYFIAFLLLRGHWNYSSRDLELVRQIFISWAVWLNLRSCVSQLFNCSLSGLMATLCYSLGLTWNLNYFHCLLRLESSTHLPLAHFQPPQHLIYSFQANSSCSLIAGLKCSDFFFYRSCFWARLSLIL